MEENRKPAIISSTLNDTLPSLENEAASSGKQEKKQKVLETLNNNTNKYKVAQDSEIMDGRKSKSNTVRKSLSVAGGAKRKAGEAIELVVEGSKRKKKAK